MTDMTAKESKAVASVGCLNCGGDGIDPVPLIHQRCCGRGVGGECCGEPDQEIEPQPCEQCGGAGKLATESALHAAEAERDALQSRLDAVVSVVGLMETEGRNLAYWTDKLRAAIGCATTGEGG